MGNLTRETIEALRSGTIAAEDEVLRIAGDLLGKANSQGGYISGFADTDAEEITQDEAEQLKQALAGLLAKTHDPDTVISVIWALGKSNANWALSATWRLQSSGRVLGGSRSIDKSRLMPPSHKPLAGFLQGQHGKCKRRHRRLRQSHQGNFHRVPWIIQRHKPASKS